MRIIFTAGGSGGHIFPLIAVKREIDSIAREEYFPLEFQFLGKADKEILLKEGIKPKPVIEAKWRRYFTFKNLIDILKFPLALIQSLIYIWIFMPDIVFSKGGPGSLAIVIVAWIYQVPVIIHESDSVPGFTNKLSGPFSRKIAISFKETENFFSKRARKKIIFTGNPIRQRLFTVSSQKAKEFFNLTGERKVILIIGGSQGAEQINMVIIDAILKYIEKYEVIHICGQKNFKDLDLLIKGILRDQQRKFYHLLPSLNEEEMGAAYTVADIVISRAGAGAIFELAAFQKPSVIIPLQGGAQDHQTKNAYYFSKEGAAAVVEGANVTLNLVCGRITQIIESKKIVAQMKEACKKFAKPDAARKVVEIILENA